MTNDTITNVSNVIKIDDVIVVGIWSSLLSYGLITNLLTLVGISKSRSMRKLTSYWLILSVALCDIMMIIISMAHLMPATLFHDSFVTVYDYRNAFAIFLYNVFWYSGVVQLAGMALNRYVNIVHPLYYRRLFTPCYTCMFLGFMYTVGISVSLPALFPCCYTIYDHHIWLTYYQEADTDYYLVDMIVNSLSLAVMIICYSAILWKVRKSQASIRKHKGAPYGGIPKPTYGGIQLAKNFDSHHNQIFNKVPTAGQPSRREMKLLTQFVIVSVVFLLTFFMWQWLFKLPSNSKWIYFTSTTFFFINNAVNPTVYLIYNTTLRKELHNLFMNVCLKRNSKKSTPIIISDNNDNEHDNNNSDMADSCLNLNFNQDDDSVNNDNKVIDSARFINLPGVGLSFYHDIIVSNGSRE